MSDSPHKVVSTRYAPEPGFYAQGRTVDFGSVLGVFTAGQCGVVGQDGKVIGDAGEQTSSALQHILGIVNAAGGTINDLVRVQVYVVDLHENQDRVRSAYQSFFARRPYSDLPARALIGVSALPLKDENTLVEIVADAYIAKKSWSDEPLPFPK